MGDPDRYTEPDERAVAISSLVNDVSEQISEVGNKILKTIEDAIHDPAVQQSVAPHVEALLRHLENTLPQQFDLQNEAIGKTRVSIKDIEELEPGNQDNNNNNDKNNNNTNTSTIPTEKTPPVTIERHVSFLETESDVEEEPPRHRSVQRRQPSGNSGSSPREKPNLTARLLQFVKNFFGFFSLSSQKHHKQVGEASPTSDDGDTQKPLRNRGLSIGDSPFIELDTTSILVAGVTLMTFAVIIRSNPPAGMDQRRATLLSVGLMSSFICLLS